MRTIFRQGASLLIVLLSLSACSNSNDKYPDEYVGFDQVKKDFSVDKKMDEQDISIKIIVAEKKDVDREVTLVSKWQSGETDQWKPEAPVPFKLLDEKVIIPAKKKSATARIRVFPKRIRNSEEVRIICTPKDKDVKQSQITLKLVAK